MSTTEPTEDRALRWVHLGREYRLSFDDITIDLETECRRHTGIAPLAILGMTADQMGRDVLAMLVWLARRIGGEAAVVQAGRRTQRLWDACKAEMTWQAFAEWEWLGEMADEVEVEGPLDPESSGGI